MSRWIKLVEPQLQYRFIEVIQDLNSSFIATDETPASIVNNVFCHTRSRIQIAKKRSNSRAQSDPRDARNINEDKSLTSHTVADSE